MKIFWSWQSDTPGEIGRYLVRDALKDAIEKLKLADEIEDAIREALHLDQDIQGTTGSPDLVRTILEKIENSEVVVADTTIVGKTNDGDCLINSNVAIELGYALRACTDEKVILVFNKHYGRYEDLPFDLRHKGGAVVFDLAAGSGRGKIASERKALADKFGRKLMPLLGKPIRLKESLSLRAVLDHKPVQSWRMPSGGTDDVIQVLASVENEGKQAATDFRLDVEVPGEFVDGGGHRLAVGPLTPGLHRFSITNQDEAVRLTHLYPQDKTKVIIFFNCGIRDDIKRLHPEALDKEIVATVYSGNMKPRKTLLKIADLLR
ncbi:MAG: hypothetical protein WAN65_23175 [Candidatus Sulfotelmatobacter sp.]